MHHCRKSSRSSIFLPSSTILIATRAQTASSKKSMKPTTCWASRISGRIMMQIDIKVRKSREKTTLWRIKKLGREAWITELTARWAELNGRDTEADSWDTIQLTIAIFRRDIVCRRIMTCSWRRKSNGAMHLGPWLSNKWRNKFSSEKNYIRNTLRICKPKQRQGRTTFSKNSIKSATR